MVSFSGLLPWSRWVALSGWLLVGCTSTASETRSYCGADGEFCSPLGAGGAALAGGGGTGVAHGGAVGTPGPLGVGGVVVCTIDGCSTPTSGHAGSSGASGQGGAGGTNGGSGKGGTGNAGGGASQGGGGNAGGGGTGGAGAAGKGGSGAGGSGTAGTGAAAGTGGGGTAGSGGGCDPTAQKTCGAGCVAKTDPLYGCAAPGCDACALPNAAPGCSPQAACAVVSCKAGFFDCDGVASNGCEASASDPAAGCGTCTPCKDAMGSTFTCKAGACVPSACAAGFAFCGGTCVSAADPGFGCGSCTACADATVSAFSCLSFTCTPTACAPGYALCGNQCVSATDPATGCGSCKPCADPTVSAFTCAGASCAPVACSVGYALCGGACVNVNDPATGCGSCSPCASPGAATFSCAPMCAVATCAVGLTLCNGSCVDTTTDPKSCGVCGNACVTGACAGGVCGTTADLAAGGETVCARKTDGRLYCWGRDDFGQVGAGTPKKDACFNVYVGGPAPECAVGAPAKVALPADVTSVGAGDRVTCAVRAGGSVWCWGIDQDGTLGDGSYDIMPNIPHPVPVQVSGLGGITAVAPGSDHVCAGDGSKAFCWGRADKGQLLDGSYGGNDCFASGKPCRDTAQIVSQAGPVSRISAGGSHSCALTTNGDIVCAGDDTAGQIGDGSVGSACNPFNGQVSDCVSPPKLAVSGALGVSVRLKTSCAVRVDGSVWCWGFDGNGEVGDGSTGTDLCPAATFSECKLSPTKVPGLPPVTEVVRGGTFTCARTQAGAVWCWGRNDFGQVTQGVAKCSDSSSKCALAPVQVPLPGTAAQIALTGSGACARLGDGRIYCWGDDRAGELGQGTWDTAAHASPLLVSFIPN